MSDLETLETSKSRSERFMLLHVIATVDPRGGGPIEGILQQAKIRAEENYEVHIASLDPPNAPFLQNYPAKVHALGEIRDGEPQWHRYLPWRHYRYEPHAVSWLKANIHKFDAVVVNGIWNYSAMAARRALVGSGIPYVVFTHGMLDPWFKKTYPLKALMKQLFWLFCEGPLLNNANGVLFTTEEERVVSRNAFWPYRVRERVVGYGTGDVRGDSEKQIAAFRAVVPELGDRKFLLFLSRIHPKKGCDLLLKAFASIQQQAPDLHLVMAGPDQVGWKSDLMEIAKQAGISDKIHWPGMLSGDVKWGAYRAAEAFVLPSHQENFGIVVAEAMACECPVLISNKVNIWREIESSGSGIVEADTQSGATRLLERFLVLGSDERAQMKQRSRQCFLEKFEMRGAVKNINSVLEEIAQQRVGMPSH